MDVFQMRIIVALAYEGNMTRAADCVHISQPTLSYHVDKIEQELGFALFDRSRKGTVLTPAGELFAEGIGRIVTDYDLLVERSRRAHASSLKPMVMLATTADSHDVIELLEAQLTKELPGFSFQQRYCSNFGVLDDVRSGRVDIAYRTSAGLDKAKDLEFVALAQVEDSWLVPERHPLADRSELSLKDLEGYRIFLVPEGSLSTAADDLRSAIAEQKLDIEVHDYEDESAMMLSVLAGDAVAMTRSGSGALLPQGIKCIPMSSHGYANVEGLVYRSADKIRIAPVIEVVRNLFSGDLPS